MSLTHKPSTRRGARNAPRERQRVTERAKVTMKHAPEGTLRASRIHYSLRSLEQSKQSLFPCTVGGFQPDQTARSMVTHAPKSSRISQWMIGDTERQGTGSTRSSGNDADGWEIQLPTSPPRKQTIIARSPIPRAPDTANGNGRLDLPVKNLKRSRSCGTVWPIRVARGAHGLCTARPPWPGTLQAVDELELEPCCSWNPNERTTTSTSNASVFPCASIRSSGLSL